VPTEELISKIARLLESQAWVIKSLAYSADREKDTDLLNSIDARLIGKSRLARLIWAYIRAGMKNPTDLERITGELDRFVTEVQSNLEQIWSEDSLEMAAPEFKEISSGLTEAGLPLELAAKFTDYLRYSVELPEGGAEGLRMSPRSFRDAILHFRGSAG
jgi:hypothetical protein